MQQDNNKQCENKNTGRWSKEEHERFMYAMMQYGKDWKKVEEYVKSRTGSQVRSHAQKFFNKLQKPVREAADPQNRHQQAEFSETEFDHSPQINNEVTPCTPIELVSLIKKQQKEQGGKINLGSLKRTLADHQNNEQKELNSMPQSLLRAKSYKSMNNILSAYEEVNEDQKMQNEDESFFILLTKKYKRYFNKSNDFDMLIDLHQPVKEVIEQVERVGRKRSFTLPEGNELSGDQLEEKIEEIKKKIKTESNQKSCPRVAEKRQVHPVTLKAVDMKQISNSQKNAGQEVKQEVKLTTIPEKDKEEDEAGSNRLLDSPVKDNSPFVKN